MRSFNIYEVITQRFIEQLENGVIPWRKPWTGTRNGAYSRCSKRPYSLLNQMMLGKPGEWLTYRQISQLGGCVKNGERSSMVVYWNIQTVPDEDDADNIKRIPILRYYKVFHIDQTTGIKPLEFEEINAILEPNRDAETVIRNYIAKTGVAFNVKLLDNAFYDPKQDRITIPCMEQYLDVAEYYSTAFHEITHSTGHKDRLDRLVSSAFLRDRNKYAKEELVAEIGSASLCNLCGVETPSTFENSAAYIQSWINALKGDKYLIVSASGKAQKAVDFILKDTNVINELRLYIKAMRKVYPEITDTMLYTEDTDENIFYMNGNDGTSFDYAVNNSVCEFVLFYKSTNLGFIKVVIGTDDYMYGYLYLDEGKSVPVKFQKVYLPCGSALLLATLMNLQADNKGLYDRAIDKINLNYNVKLNDCYNFIQECERI